MATPNFTLSAHYVRLIAEQVRRQGADVGRWLAASGLSEVELSEPTVSIEYEQFERLVRDALVVTREPALGLLVGERLLANTHGILGYGAISSGTLRQALELFERYARLRTSLVAISTEVRPDVVRVRVDEVKPLGEIRRPVLEAILLSIRNVFGVIWSTDIDVTVSFPFPAPDYVRVASELFAGSKLSYGADWAGFTLPLDVLDAPLTMADPDAFAEAARICQAELDKLTADESTATRIRRLLLEKQSGFPSLPMAARLVHMTPRTLHRRLLEEGTSYRELLEDVRHALAVEHVNSGRFSMDEIAYRLGYSDLANFRRAFKRWERVSPSAYRAGHNPPKRR